MKLWLCGMIKGDRPTLEKSIPLVYDYFDGLIFVVDDRVSSSDFEWLYAYKKDGDIFKKRWVNDHAHTSNEVLLRGIMNEGDFFVWIDETDQLNLDFVKGLREQIKKWGEAGVGAVHIDHPFVLMYNDGLRFSGSPHWGVTNVLGQHIALEKEPGYKKENYVTNGRDFFRSAFYNPAKYWFTYPNFSNHTQLLYAHFGQEVWRQHELSRIQFRYYCRYQLGIELSIDGLINYLAKHKGSYTGYLEQMIETEIHLKDLFRLYVLKQPVQDLVDNRFNWSYFKWKETGKVDQKKDDGFVGLYNKYNLSIGKQEE